MTVAELIERLQAMPNKLAPVYVRVDTDYGHDGFEVDTVQWEGNHVIVDTSV